MYKNGKKPYESIRKTYKGRQKRIKWTQRVSKRIKTDESI